MADWLSLPEDQWEDRKTGGRRRPHRRRWSMDLKDAMVEAQGGLCCLCGLPFNTSCAPLSGRYPTFEHAVALARGGADHPENLVISCYSCNNGRGVG